MKFPRVGISPDFPRRARKRYLLAPGLALALFAACLGALQGLARLNWDLNSLKHPTLHLAANLCDSPPSPVRWFQQMKPGMMRLQLGIS